MIQPKSRVYTPSTAPVNRPFTVASQPGDSAASPDSSSAWASAPLKVSLDQMLVTAS